MSPNVIKEGQDKSLEIKFEFQSSPQDGVKCMANYKSAFFFSKTYLVKARQKYFCCKLSPILRYFGQTWLGPFLIWTPGVVQQHNISILPHNGNCLSLQWPWSEIGIVPQSSITAAEV